MRNTRIQERGRRNTAADDHSRGDRRLETGTHENRDKRRSNSGRAACRTRKRNSNNGGHQAAGRKQEKTQLLQRLREKRNQMRIAAHQFHNLDKAHGRADGDDEVRVRHRFIELMERDHRLEGEECHDEAAGNQNQPGLIPLDESPDDTDHRDNGNDCCKCLHCAKSPNVKTLSGQSQGNFFFISEVGCRRNPKAECVTPSNCRRRDFGLKNYKKTPQSEFIYMTWSKGLLIKKPINRA